MSSSTLTLAVITRENLIVQISNFIDPSKWSPFVPVRELGSNNVGVSLSIGDRNSRLRLCAVDDSLSNRLHFTQRGMGFTTPLLLTTGAGLASIVAMSSSTSDVLALGGPTVAGWAFGLPYFVVDATGSTFTALGDQTARLHPGPLSEDDPPVALDIWGPPSEFRLCLATDSGGLYFVDATPTGTSTFEDVKAAGAGDPGKVVNVSVCRAADLFHLCVVNDAGKILHTIRRRTAGGEWLPWGDVSAALRTGETFSQVAVGYWGDGRQLDLAAVTNTGGIYYSNRTGERSPDPLWSPLVDVKATAGNPGTVISADIDTIFSEPG